VAERVSSPCDEPVTIASSHWNWEWDKGSFGFAPAALRSGWHEHNCRTGGSGMPTSADCGRCGARIQIHSPSDAGV